MNADKQRFSAPPPGPAARVVRVLIVDDSFLWTTTLAELLEADPEIEVIDVVGDGQGAILATKRLQPDLVMMDIRMPVLGGLEAISTIMAQSPTPILAMTSDPATDKSPVTFESLRRGALDLVVKDTTYPPPDAFAFALRSKVKELASVHVVRHPNPAVVSRPLTLIDLPKPASAIRLVAIVASTGGPAALAAILQGLHPRFPASVVVVQHLMEGFAPIFADWLHETTPMSVLVAKPGDRLLPGQVLIAPSDQHLRVLENGMVDLNQLPPYRGNRPSGDLLLSSVAASYGPRALGLVLTGMGRDGSEGLGELRRAGGRAFAQDQGSCLVFGMPAAAEAAHAVEELVPLEEIPTLLNRLVPAR